MRLIFDVDDSRNSSTYLNSKGEKKHGFRGRPKSNDLLVSNGKISKSINNNNNDNNNNILVMNSYVNSLISETKSNEIKKEDKSDLEIPSKSTLTILNSSNDNNTENTNTNNNSNNSDNHNDNNTDNSTTSINNSVNVQSLLNSMPSNPQNTASLLNSNHMNLNTSISTTNTASTISDKEFELDFNDEQQFEHAFLSGLDYILDNYDNELLINSVDLQFPISNSTLNTPLNNNNFTNFNESSISSNIHNVTMNHFNNVTNNNNNYELEIDSSNLGPQLKKKEESHILKHFFEKVIYLLDAHPQNPWPQLMMKFGSMDLAKSCFLSLSSMHLYVNNGGDEFYKKGLLHINNTMEYLIKYVKTSGIQKKENNDNESNNDKKNINDLGLNVPNIISKIKSESNKKKGTNFMVILLLLYVHLLFAVLESGRSALARMFLKLSSSIASDPIFNKKMKKIKQSQPLLCVLSWFDTVAALVSPDCRIPYCDPKWFGESNDIISTDKMNGCPVGMFRVLYDLSLYRRDTMFLFSQKQCLLQDFKQSHKILLDLRDRCLHYRDHVLYILPHGSNFSYIDRLKCAQLWSLAGILVTIQLELHYFRKLPHWIEQNRNLISESELPNAIPLIHIYSEKATAIVTEFLSVYSTIPSESPIITQMVWPIFYVGICSCTPENRSQSWQCLKTLYETVKMGTIKSNMDIVKRVWEEGCSLESILAGEGWFENGIDLLPC
jgi:hypothetical protein